PQLSKYPARLEPRPASPSQCWSQDSKNKKPSAQPPTAPSEKGETVPIPHFADAIGVDGAFSFRSSNPLGIMITGCGCVLCVAGCVVGHPCAGIISSVPGSGAWAGITATCGATIT